MAEEQEGGGSLKSILIGLASTIALGVGGYVTKQLTGEEETKTEIVQPAAQQPQIVINNAQTQQASSGGKTVIIKEKASEHKAEAPKKKTEKEALEEEPKW